MSRPVFSGIELSDKEPELEDKGLSVSRPVFSGIEPSDKEPELGDKGLSVSDSAKRIPCGNRATPSADSTALMFLSDGADSDRGLCGLWGFIWGIP